MTGEAVLPKCYHKIKDLATLKLYLDKHEKSISEGTIEMCKYLGHIDFKPSLLSHTLATSEQPYCAVIMLLSTFSADYLVKQNEGDLDNFWRTFCVVKSTECLDRMLKNVIIDKRIRVPSYFLTLVPKGVTSLTGSEMDIPFFLAQGADPNVIVGSNSANFLEEYFFELSDRCINAFLQHGARLDRSKLKPRRKAKNSAELVDKAHAMLEFVRRRAFDVKPLAEQGPILHNMVINITPHVSFPLAKLFARQGAYLNKLEHMYRILYATINNYSECTDKKLEEVKQILHFLVKPKDFTYFLPVNKTQSRKDYFTALPAAVLLHVLTLVCERLYDVINYSLVCKAFHDLLASDCSDCIWFNISCVAPPFIQYTGIPKNPTTSAHPAHPHSHSHSHSHQHSHPHSHPPSHPHPHPHPHHPHPASHHPHAHAHPHPPAHPHHPTHSHAHAHAHSANGSSKPKSPHIASHSHHPPPVPPTHELDESDEEDDGEEEDSDSSDDGLDYDSDDSEPDHLNQDLSANDQFSDFWSSQDFALHGDSQNVLLRAIRCGVPLHIVKALLSPENKAFVDSFGRNAVHWCAMNDTLDMDIVRELVTSGIQADKKDKFLRTPLHYALLRGRNKLAELLASVKPSDGTRSLRQSFDPAVAASPPKFSTQPDISDFSPSSRLVEDETLVEMVTKTKPQVTTKRISRKCYLPTKAPNYPKRFLKMDNVTCLLPLRGLMLYARQNTPFIDIMDTETFWTQRHINEPFLKGSLLCSGESDTEFLSGSTHLAVWDIRTPNYLVKSFALPSRASTLGRTSNKVCFTCGGRAYFTDIRTEKITELGKWGSKKKTVAAYDRDKMFVVSKNMDKIFVWDLTTLAQLEPLQGIKIDDTHPHEKRVTLKSNENTLVCAFHDRVYAWDMDNLQKRRMVCEYPYIVSLSLEQRSKYIAVGTVDCPSGIALFDANANLPESETDVVDDKDRLETHATVIASCFTMSSDEHACHVDDDCYATQHALHMGAVWSVTWCGRITVVPHFYDP